MKYSYGVPPVSGIPKEFQDQTAQFLIHSLCFDLCMCAGEKTIVGIWKGGGELNPSCFPCMLGACGMDGSSGRA